MAYPPSRRNFRHGRRSNPSRRCQLGPILVPFSIPFLPMEPISALKRVFYPKVLYGSSRGSPFPDRASEQPPSLPPRSSTDCAPSGGPILLKQSPVLLLAEQRYRPFGHLQMFIAANTQHHLAGPSPLP